MQAEPLPLGIDDSGLAKSMTQYVFGTEQIPVLVIDDFYPDAQSLVEQAGPETGFASKDDDFYPGVKRDLKTPAYLGMLESLCGRLAKVFARIADSECRVDSSCYALTNLPAERLLPIQRIPHFDTTDKRQIAAVHYLCDSSCGGTSFYRHRATGFESISPERSQLYQQSLGRQATTEGLPPPAYISGSTALFEKTGGVDALFNRIVFYPSNILHSGDIRHLGGGAADTKRRLTITSNLVFR